MKVIIILFFISLLCACTKEVVEIKPEKEKILIYGSSGYIGTFVVGEGWQDFHPEMMIFVYDTAEFRQMGFIK